MLLPLAEVYGLLKEDIKRRCVLLDEEKPASLNRLENSHTAPLSFVCAAQGVSQGHVPWITMIHT